jgi:PleD family two-component response regulator
LADIEPVDKENAHTTIRVGGAFRMPDEEQEPVLLGADIALYQAKERGRNCVVVVHPHFRLKPCAELWGYIKQ